MDEKRVIVAIQHNSKSSSHGFWGDVDLSLLVGGDVDLEMADILVFHECDIVLWQRLWDEGAASCQLQAVLNVV